MMLLFYCKQMDKPNAESIKAERTVSPQHRKPSTWTSEPDHLGLTESDSALSIPSSLHACLLS